jgi:outer membrane protein TolC
VAVLQEIELNRQGRHREKDGLAELSRTQSTIARETTLVVTEVEHRFFDALYWRAVLELEETLATLQDDQVQVLERRFQAVLAPSSAIVLGRIEAQAQHQQVELLRVRRDAAMVELRRVLAISETGPMELQGDFEHWKWPEVSSLLGPSFAGAVERNVGGEPATGQGARSTVVPRQAAGTGAVLTDELAEERSDVRAASYASEAARARLDLATAERIPNITMGPVYEKDESGTNFLGVQLQVPIPVFSTGKPKERERQAELEQSLEELRQLRLKAKMEIESAVSRYEKALRLRETFRDELLVDFEKNLERVVHQFEAGRASIVDVFTARGKLIQARQNYIETVYELALSAADLTVATPLPFAALLPSLPTEEF